MQYFKTQFQVKVDYIFIYNQLETIFNYLESKIERQNSILIIP